MASIAPLQLYCSGLAFAPAQSVIKGTFLGEIPKYIRPLPGVMDAWSTALQTLEGHSGKIYSVAFSPDGLTLASGSSDSTIKLWDTATGMQRQTLEGHSDSVFSVAFSPDGLTLASGSYNIIKLWDTVTGIQRQTLEGHSDWIDSVTFSPDGLTLVSGSRDRTIKLWDTATGTQRQTLKGYSNWVNSVAFSPDGLKPSLEKAPANSQISLSSNWVSLNGENLLWLSAEYRSFVCQAVNDAKIALGYMDGRVLVTGFHTHMP
jgi:WD40 repeat protein